jgi:hypothetical protein
MLGGAVIYIDKVQSKVSDPPATAGTVIKDVVATEHEIIIERKGYEVYDANVTVKADMEYQKITIGLTPLQGTPTITESDLKDYLDSSSYSTSNYPTNQVLNPYTRSQFDPTYSYNGLSNIFTGTNSGISNVYNNQTQSYTPINSSAVIPLQMAINSTNNVNSNVGQIEIQVLDSQSRYINLSTLNNYQTQQTTPTNQLLRYACLEPNKQYSAVIKNGNLMPYTVPFYSGNGSSAIQIVVSVDDYLAYANGQQIIPLSVSNIPIQYANSTNNCQGKYNSNGNFNYGGANKSSTQTFASQSLDLGSLSNYSVIPSLSGNYYLANKTNQFDYHKLYFIDSGDNKKGVVFLPDTAGDGVSVNSGKWYIGLYTRSDKGEVKIDSPLTRVDFTPQKYAQYLNNTLVENFSTTAPSPSATTAENPDAAIPPKTVEAVPVE